MNIVILDGYTSKHDDLNYDRFHAMGDVRVYGYTPAELFAERACNADVLLVTNRIKVTGSMMDKCPNIRYIGVLSTGYNAIDIQAASERGIVVTNVPDYSTPSVAQLTFALLLELCNHAGNHSRDVHKGQWAASPDDCFWRYPLTELYGKTMGLIGFGSIGKAVARIAGAFDMRVLVYSRTPRKEPGVLFYPFDTLLRESDVLSLHCPLTEQTRGIINRQALEKMKRGAFLINTARGPLLDEDSVARALESGHLAGVAVDVTATEPIPANSPLYTAPHCIITPHIGWATRESRMRLITITADNLQTYLDGEPINLVNMQV